MLLAISGAGAKGPILLQMYEDLRKRRQVSAVAGISAGGILGLFASLHQAAPKARKKEVDVLLRAFVKIQAHFLKPWRSNTILNGIVSWFYHDSFYRSGSLLQLATTVANTCKCETLNLPLSLGVWDSTNGVYKEKTFARGTSRKDEELLNWIVASASVPLLFPGKVMDGHVHRDGAFGHEIPVHTILKHRGPVVILTAHCISGPPREPPSASIKDVGTYIMNLRGYECMERDLFHIYEEKGRGRVELHYPKECVRAKYKGSKKQLDRLLEVGRNTRKMPLEQWCTEVRIAAALRV